MVSGFSDLLFFMCVCVAACVLQASPIYHLSYDGGDIQERVEEWSQYRNSNVTCSIPLANARAVVDLVPLINEAAACANLLSFDCTGDDSEIDCLADALVRVAEKTTLQGLCLQRVTLSDANWSRLFDAIRSENIECCRIIECRITDAHLVPLARVLARQPNLYMLDLKANAISGANLSLLAPVLLKKEFETVNLDYNPVGDDGMRTIGQLANAGHGVHFRFFPCINAALIANAITNVDCRAVIEVEYVAGEASAAAIVACMRKSACRWKVRTNAGDQHRCLLHFMMRRQAFWNDANGPRALIKDICMAMAPLQLPPYVLLEIIDWLPVSMQDLVKYGFITGEFILPPAAGAYIDDIGANVSCMHFADHVRKIRLIEYVKRFHQRMLAHREGESELSAKKALLSC
jgi:hypothetical protein